MSELLFSLLMICLPILAGYAVGKRVFPDADASYIANSLAYYIFSPALTFVLIAATPLENALSWEVGIIAAAGAVAAGATELLLRLSGSRGARARVSVAAFASCSLNSNNLGIPLAIYLLGEVELLIGVILYQNLVLTPINLFRFALTAEGKRDLSVRRLGRLFFSPLLIATVAGVGFAVFDWRLPAGPESVISFVGAAAVPVMLVSFGLSFVRSPLKWSWATARSTALPVGMKTLIMPVIALIIGIGCGLDRSALLGLLVIGALPTAQNLFVFAQQLTAEARFARDLVVFSTLAAGLTIPVFYLSAQLF